MYIYRYLYIYLLACQYLPNQFLQSMSSYSYKHIHGRSFIPIQSCTNLLMFASHAYNADSYVKPINYSFSEVVL